MQKNTRWTREVLKEAAKTDHAMPWARGARRAEMIARRKATTTRKTAHA